MRVLVTGSRDWDDELAIRHALFTLPQDTVIVHGDAPGADRMAQRLAREFGFADEPHPAKWRTLGKSAGPIRNQEMVDLGADICFAFPGPESVGTWDCVRRAQKAGILVLLYGTTPIESGFKERLREVLDLD